MNHHRNQQANLALDHQRFFFTLDSVTFAWKTLKNSTFIYYQLVAESNNCDLNSKALLNISENESISLPPEDLLDDRNTSVYLNLTAVDVNNGTILTIERFQFYPGSELIIESDVFDH